MRLIASILCSAILIGPFVGFPCYAETATLRRGAVDTTFYPTGYDGAADTNIFYYSPNPGHPADPQIWMRSSDGKNAKVRSSTGPSNLRTLYRFDLSAMSNKGVEVLGDAVLTLTSAGGITGGTYNLYQIADANAGWVESSNNITLNPSSASFPNKSNQGDPTWWYKSIDNDTYAATTGFQTTNDVDTTSVPWASGQTNLGPPGSNPEGYANTGGLWNPIDLVDQDLSTEASDYLTMYNMDPVASSDLPALDLAATFVIPQAMIQRWIDEPNNNAGLLGRYLLGSTGDFWSSETGTAEVRPTLSFDYSMPVTLVADFNGDGKVGDADLALWSQQFGQSGTLSADADANGLVDGTDFLVWQNHQGGVIGGGFATVVPEPVGALLLFCGAVAACSLRRRNAVNP
ncbi:MAG: hypothetical protein KDA61_14560 [Planctomycetales bacterium]|nr:hypothetical protein [Planctomycetales bacterium]